MIRIPYGESDFKTLMVENLFYQDRTMFIPKLEQWYAKYPIFLRPRRFGKSLFVSMLHYYYGLEYKKDFQNLFGNLFIGKNPTPLANSYLVLRFEFSRIDTSTHERTYQGFLLNVLLGARSFLATYSDFFSEEQKNMVLSQTNPEAVIKSILTVCKDNQLPHKIYLLVDEYDHFANELLSFDLNRFKSDVSQNGFVRKFYESIKNGTGEGVVGRLFITGVSPITLDSLTSGFNIGDNISLNPVFHEMMGFTATEVNDILVKSDIDTHKIPSMMADLQVWYDGYRFSKQAKLHLFNPDMVLYFLKEYSISAQYPDKMLDTNIISDYRKIGNIFKIGGDELEKFELLENLVKKGHLDFNLTEIYNLEAPFSQNDFLSLLFYMGLLSLRENNQIVGRYEMPNYVIKKLYFEFFTSIYLEKTRFNKIQTPIADAVNNLVNKGNPSQFFNIVEEILQENHSNRDEMTYAEKHLQTLMIGLLYPFEAYMIHSEYEAKRGYPDIFIEKKSDKHINFEIVLELKYVKKKDVEPLASKISDAQTQLNSYMTSKRFARPEVRGFYVVFLGGKVHEWKEWSTF
jgi:hypothetical protein